MRRGAAAVAQRWPDPRLDFSPLWSNERWQASATSRAAMSQEIHDEEIDPTRHRRARRRMFHR